MNARYLVGDWEVEGITRLKLFGVCLFVSSFIFSVLFNLTFNPSNINLPIYFTDKASRYSSSVGGAHWKTSPI